VEERKGDYLYSQRYCRSTSELSLVGCRLLLLGSTEVKFSLMFFRSAEDQNLAFTLLFHTHQCVWLP
jgi:hypothetical protein